MNDDRARQGVEHLQAAAVEIIGALRAFLDIAEEVVRDPATAATLAASLVEAARQTDHGDTDASPESRVKRIRVS